MNKEQEKKTSEFWKVEEKLSEDVETIKQRGNKWAMLIALITALLGVAGTVALSDVFETDDEKPDFFLMGGTIALVFGCCFGAMTKGITMLFCNPFKNNETTEKYVKAFLEKLYVDSKGKFTQEELAKYFVEGQQMSQQHSEVIKVLLKNENVQHFIEKLSESSKKINEKTQLLPNP